MLICDIDNTLIGDRESLTRLLHTIQAGSESLAFGVATGRRLDSTLRVLKEWGVPLPDVLITAVGSEVQYGPSLHADHEWSRHINFRWNREAILEALHSLPGLRLQPVSEQRSHKVSYFVDPVRMPGVPEIRRVLRRHGVHVNVIYSHQAYIDILPIRASKGLAVRFVADRWGLSMDHVLVAGDSGNDEEMLIGHSLGVVVGNHSPELDYLKGRKRVYFAQAKRAAGVLEGIEHFRFMGRILQPRYD
jgi:sucrose-phosphate synthase